MPLGNERLGMTENGIFKLGPAMRSPAMQSVRRVVARCSQTDVPMLLVGEQGAGKEWLARQIHCNGNRSGGPFIKVHCHTVTPELLAHQFQLAIEGTLFLKDIDQAAPTIQTELLTLLERDSSSNGATPLRSPRPRWMASSVHYSALLISRQLVRPDLFCLLCPVTINLPPLRERFEDIPALVEHFLADFSSRYQLAESLAVVPEMMVRLQQFDWPGNIGQLESCIHRCVALSEGGRLEVDLALEVALWSETNFGRQASEHITAGETRNLVYAGQRAEIPNGSEFQDSHIDLEELTRRLVHVGILAADAAREDLHPFIVNAVEKELILQVLRRCEQVQTKAAGQLGINRNTLHKKVKDYQLDENTSGIGSLRPSNAS